MSRDLHARYDSLCLARAADHQDVAVREAAEEVLHDEILAMHGRLMLWRLAFWVAVGVAALVLVVAG